ncbi:MAG: hypothetical protein IKL02_10615, partial [Kiritimatiellae bacterium]|nr:hypothetical protein [Kiritimatiellia bacterium]
PEDVLVYVEWSQGRANRPYQKLSTVAATSAALCKVTECFVGENKTGGGGGIPNCFRRIDFPERDGI